MFRVLDLFSGIGAFTLGLERTGGFKTVAFCEIEVFCRRILTKHWPDVPCFDDIRTLKGTDIGPIDAICGGFPCQDISIAGRGKGLSGDRSGLWREYARLIEELRPRFVFIENSPKLRARGLEQILTDLDALGYDAEWHCIPAAHVGAPHRRDRIWVLAYRQEDAFGSYANCLRSYPSDMHVNRDVELLDEQKRIFGSVARWGAEPDMERVVDGAPSKLDIARLRAVGNAVVPQIPEMLGNAVLETLRRSKCL